MPACVGGRQKREREKRGNTNQRTMAADGEAKVTLGLELASNASKTTKAEVVVPEVGLPKQPKESKGKQTPSSQTKPPNSKASKAGAALKRTKSAPPAVLQRKRSRSGPKSKSSSFIGVSQYRRTGRWEAHIWDCAKSRAKPGAKGRQLHLGSFDCAEDAARAYDRAAIHFRGTNADTNYPREQYLHDPVLNALKNLGKDEFVIKLRGVAQHHKMQAQKKKEKLQQAAASMSRQQQQHRPPPIPNPSSHSLKRTASYPLQSPHSVLQHPGGFGASDEYVDGLGHHHHHLYAHTYQQEKYQAQMFPITQHRIPRRRSNNDMIEHVQHQRRPPLPYREQTLVYRGRVLGATCSDAMDLHPCQSDPLLCDPNMVGGGGIPTNQMAYNATNRKQQQEANNKHNNNNANVNMAKDMHLFLDETLMTFPGDDHLLPSELQSPVFRYDSSKPNVSRPLQDQHYIQAIVEDYHLFEETNNMLPDLRALGNRTSGMYPERGPAPLMEGMGEVDTGTS